MSENSVENAVKTMFEAADNASQAGVVVDWRSTATRMANALLEDNKRLEEAVISEQEAMREVLEAEKLVDKD